MASAIRSDPGVCTEQACRKREEGHIPQLHSQILRTGVWEGQKSGEPVRGSSITMSAVMTGIKCTGIRWNIWRRSTGISDFYPMLARKAVFSGNIDGFSAKEDELVELAEEIRALQETDSGMTPIRMRVEYLLGRYRDVRQGLSERTKLH